MEENEFKKPDIVTKANILNSLQKVIKKSKIEKLFTFNLAEWEADKMGILSRIAREFGGEEIVVRSSAVNEDRLSCSMAGFFHSELNVSPNNPDEVENAIKKVFDSYTQKDCSSPLNQILIQKQTKNIAISGVLFTRNIENGSPYYIINFDDKTGLSDTVTKGIEKQTIKIARFAKTENIPEKFKNLLLSVKELEDIIPYIGLDIEFAITKAGEIVLFQVRPLAIKGGIKEIIKNLKKEKAITKKVNNLKEQFRLLSKPEKHLHGKNNFFCDMPDWNPAEIIGNNPNHLDYSLYDYIITDSAWHEARTSQGYYNVNPAKLVVLFGNKPYVNVRNTFNSFIPASISPNLREKLIEFYMEKLRRNPELQDKVEFEILYTCFDFDFYNRVKELQKAGFNADEIKELKESLIELTNNLIKKSKESIERDLGKVRFMQDSRIKSISEKSKNTEEALRKTIILLDECRKNGTVQFSRLARLGFIGKIMLKSLVKTGVIDLAFYNNFLNSVNTVASKINEDFQKLMEGYMKKEDFLALYGHLRPGTYDITSRRYDKNPSLLSTEKRGEIKKAASNLSIDKSIKERVGKLLKENSFTITSDEFFQFVTTSLEARELSKFEFTKNLSEAIELIAFAGERFGFKRRDLSQLDVSTLKECIGKNDGEIKKLFSSNIKKKLRERELNNNLILPATIFSEKDFEVVAPYLSKPNFITQKKVSGELAFIPADKEPIQLDGKIVVLENGDPGYDWIFTKKIAGLITKYGGVASHMSIRCAEFGIPAAIGCGEVFEQLKNADSILLDCQNALILPGGIKC